MQAKTVADIDRRLGQIDTAIEEAAKTVHHMDWFEVAEMRGAIKNGKVSEFQVTVRIGFKIEH